MSKRFCAVGAVLTICALLATAAAAQQPRIANGQVVPRPAASLAHTFRSVVAAQADIAWVGYSVPVRDRNRVTCCWSGADGTNHFSGTMSSGDVPCCGACGLEPSMGGVRSATAPATSAPGPIKLEGSDQLVVLFRIADKQVERVRTFSEDCALDAGGRTVHWLQNVRPADSIALLASLIDAQPERKSRITNATLAAISQHAEPAAIPVIERLARSHATAGVRGEALFWLAQMAGDKVAVTITAAIENDPDTEVKRRAVFALSQLPKNEGVPLMIDVARRNKNAAVRKQAMFWLGQSRDPRAVEFFAEILK